MNLEVFEKYEEMANVPDEYWDSSYLQVIEVEMLLMGYHEDIPKEFYKGLGKRGAIVLCIQGESEDIRRSFEDPNFDLEFDSKAHGFGSDDYQYNGKSDRSFRPYS